MFWEKVVNNEYKINKGEKAFEIIEGDFVKPIYKGDPPSFLNVANAQLITPLVAVVYSMGH